MVNSLLRPEPLAPPCCLFSRCAVVFVRACNEAKEKSFVLPSDSLAPSSRLKLPGIDD